MLQSPPFGRSNRVRSRRKVGKSRRTKSSSRRREKHKETKRYPGFLTSSDIGTDRAHAGLTSKFQWVSVLFRGYVRLITHVTHDPLAAHQRGVVARTLRVLLTPFQYFNTRKPINSSNTPLDYRVIDVFKRRSRIARSTSLSAVRAIPLSHFPPSRCLRIESSLKPTTRIPPPPCDVGVACPPVPTVVDVDNGTAAIARATIDGARRRTFARRIHTAHARTHTMHAARALPTQFARAKTLVANANATTPTRRGRRADDDADDARRWCRSKS